MFATICNTYCIIQCKIQMICYINSQKHITVKLKVVHQLRDPLSIFESYIVMHRAIGYSTTEMQFKKQLCLSVQQTSDI